MTFNEIRYNTGVWLSENVTEFSHKIRALSLKTNKSRS